MRNLKLVFTLLPFLATTAMAGKPGDTVTPEALSRSEWITGQAPEVWEPGKLYILECWATWCGPCIAAIPHVDALYDKYRDKGLVVLGMNVFEDGREKVEAFVRKKGDGMSYPVSYTGKGGAFEKEWLIPAGVNSIPHAILVKDGKVLVAMHPAKITAELIDAVLAGGSREMAAIAPLAESQKQADDELRIQKEFGEAARASDLAAMKEVTAKLEASSPSHRMLDQMRLAILVREEKWDEAATIVKRLPDEPARTATINGTVRTIQEKSGVPSSFYRVLAENYGTVPVGAGGLYALRFQSRLYWLGDEREKALATVRKAMELCTSPEAGKAGPAFLAALERSLVKMEQGELPGDAEFQSWTREAAAALPQPSGGSPAEK